MVLKWNHISFPQSRGPPPIFEPKIFIYEIVKGREHLESFTQLFHALRNRISHRCVRALFFPSPSTFLFLRFTDSFSAITMAAASSSKGRINWADDDFDGPDISFAGLSLGAQISKKDDKKTQADTKPEPASVVKTDPRPKADDAESKPAAGAKEQEGENEEEEEEKEKEVIEAPDFAPEPEIKRPDGFPELKSWKRFEDGNL